MCGECLNLHLMPILFALLGSDHVFKDGENVVHPSSGTKQKVPGSPI